MEWTVFLYFDLVVLALYIPHVLLVIRGDRLILTSIYKIFK